MFDVNHDRFKRSLKEESRVASGLGGRRLPRSGGMAWSKHDTTTMGGDLKTADLLVENKRVEPHVKSVSIKREWLQKVTTGSNMQMRYPAMALTFEEAEGFEQDWMLLPMSLASRLLALLESEK